MENHPSESEAGSGGFVSHNHTQQSNTGNNSNGVYPEATHGPLSPHASYEGVRVTNNKTSRSGRLRRLFQAPSRAYLAEYAVLMIVITSLLWLATSMFGSILDYLGGKYEPSFGERFAYTASLATLAGVTVLLPIQTIFTRRTRKSEEIDSTIKNLGWRKGFLSFFLITVFLSAIGFATTLMYDIFSWLASQGLGTSDNPGFWKDILKHVFGASLFGFTAWLYARDYRAGGTVDDVHSKLSKVHRYALAFIILVLAVLFIAFPLRVQRNSFIDDTIANDLRSIKYKVEDYQRDKKKLPGSMNDIDLTDEQKAHAKAYDYKYKSSSRTSYELCAEFKTDTKDKNPGGGNPLERFSGASYYDSYAEQEDDPSRHSKGEDCFSFKVLSASYNRYDDYPDYDRDFSESEVDFQ